MPKYRYLPPARRVSFLLYPAYTGEEKLVSIHYEPRAVREAHKLGMQIYKQCGAWNGYGYPTLDRYITASNAKKIRKILAKIDKRNAKRRPQTPLTPQQKIEKWAKRLDKLTMCGLDTAQQIAKAKIDYALDRLATQMNADYSGWRIPRWQRAAERKYYSIIADPSKALDRITDAEHACAILQAHRRHTHSDYEDQLEEAKELARDGIITKDEIQQYAREHTTYYD